MTATNPTSNTNPTPVLTGVTAAQGAQQAQSGLASLTSNFQTFLSLLTTQLKNQDPLSPMDANQFTQQLVEMSGVQQQLLTNNLLTSLVAQGQGGLSNGVAYIGKDVSATSPNQNITGGQATWTYQLASNAASATGTITNSLGQTVFTGPLTGLNAGTNTFSWNGKTSSGALLPDGGPYTLSINAVDANNSAVGSQVVIQGVATSVQMNNGQPYLSIGQTLVPLSSVVGVTTTGPGS